MFWFLKKLGIKCVLSQGVGSEDEDDEEVWREGQDNLNGNTMMLEHIIYGCGFSGTSSNSPSWYP